MLDLERKVAALEADVKNLNGWQATQNGALLRVDSKVDKLQFWLMVNAVGIAGSLLLILLKGDAR